MLKRFEQLKNKLFILVAVELIIIVLSHVGFPDYLYMVQYIVLLVNAFLMFSVFYYALRSGRERVVEVSQLLGKEAQDAFEYGKISVITLDDYSDTITWISENFDDSVIGTTIEESFPHLMPLLSNKKKVIRFNHEDVIYEATLMTNDRLIFLKNVTELAKLEIINKNNSIVLGIIHLDNYEETVQYEDEQTIAAIDNNIRQSIVNWADENGMYIRRLRASQYLILLNEAIFDNVQKAKFSILNHVRKEANSMNAAITLSIAFARLSDDFTELEEMTNHALELAQARGGDQVAINTKDGEMTYYGGASEAVEKRSKVRVRVMAQNLGDVINNSTDVIIVGHKMMDFDCFGSAMGAAAIVQGFKKPCAIVMNLDDTENTLLENFKANRSELEANVQFVSAHEAMKMMGQKSLVLMVDHHSVEQTQNAEIIAMAKRIAVIDHHRRNGEFKFKPLLTYIESSASSASELIVELYQYQPSKIIIDKIVATYMYTGIIIDTNRFRHRSGSRTFEVASELRKFGADLALVEDMLRDNYTDFEMKNKILANAKIYDNYYVIAAYKHETMPRSMLSQAADEILSVREVEASFVVARISDDTIAISARSKGELNVQGVMERLGGGGHFTGAATVIRGQGFTDVVELLRNAIEKVREETEV